MVALIGGSKDRYVRRALGDEEQSPSLHDAMGLPGSGGGALPAARSMPPTPTPRHMEPTELQVGAPALFSQANSPPSRPFREPQSGPALGEPPAPQGVPTEEMDPAAHQQAVEVARQSAEAAKTASPEQKKELNSQLGEMFGGQDRLAEAYKEAIARLGGEKEVGDLRLTRQDFGLFLMDFGMRMMASQRGDVGGVIGEAGVNAVGGLIAEKAGRQAQDREYNKELRATALGIAKDEMANRESRMDARQFIETEKGLFNPRTGQYLRDPETGKPMVGATTSGQFATQINRQALIEAGVPASVATQIVAGRAPSPAALKSDLRKEWYDLLKSQGGRHEMPTGSGERKKMREWSDQDIDGWINRIVESIYPEMSPRKPALSE